jgi:hypothetical protein
MERDENHFGSMLGRIAIAETAVPVEIRPKLCPAIAAGAANKTWLEIGQSHFVAPKVGVHGHAMAAPEIRAVDEHTAHAHLAESNFLGSRLQFNHGRGLVTIAHFPDDKRFGIILNVFRAWP